jgi:TonB family protein
MTTGMVEGIWAQPPVHALGWTLVHFCWEGAAVAVLLWCALGLLERREARVRYAAALCALGLMVAAPVATFAHIAAAEYRLRALLQGPVFDIDGGIVVQVGAGDVVVPWTVRAGVALDHACEKTMPWLLLAWMAGVVLFVARLNLGLVVARRMRLVATEPAAEELIELFERLRRRIGVRRAVNLMQSAVVQVPTVIGWFRPVVLVPVSCLMGLSLVQIEAILAHELAHVRRHDYLVSVAQSVVEALLFYHPAVWWVSKQVRRERECCCDDVAVRMSGDRLAYARALSSLEEYRAGLPAMVLGANGGVLTMRIRRLLGLKESAAGSRGAAIALLAAMVVATGMYVGSVARAERAAAHGSSAQLASTQGSVGSNDQAVVAAQPAMRPVLGAVKQVNSFLQEPRGAYKLWLDEDVLWIIMPEERAAYLRLTSDLERDRFITQFWERRNPSGAPANSFKEEHYARIAYSNQHFAADGPGWKTDRGHVYIVYGKPESIDSHPSGGSYAGVPAGVPFEVWSYPSARELGQDGDVLFVDDCKCGKYRLMAKLGPIAGTAAPSARELRFDFAPLVALKDKGQPDMSCTYYAKEIHAHPGTCEEGSANAGSYYCRADDDKKAVQPQSGCEWKVKRLQDWQRSQGQHALPEGGAADQRAGIEKEYPRGRAVLVSSAATGQAGGPAAPSGPVHVASGAMVGNLIDRPDPVYPPIAKAAHVQGSVVLHAIISKTGTVESLDVVSGRPMLTASAKDAVKRWVYKPYMVKGEPTEVETTITVNFTFGDATPAQPPAEQGQGSGPQRISSGAMMGNLIARPNPVYPAEARAAGIQGSVLLRAIISKTGDIEDLKVVSGPKELTESAIDAVKQWKYRPYLLNGEPTEVDTTITVNYTLEVTPPPPPPPPPAGSADLRGPPDEVDASGMQPKRIGNGVSAPLLVFSPDPEMSEEAKRDKVSGNVLLNLWVDENGNPTHVRVRRGVGHGLDEKAVEAVKQYKFKPAMEDGKPVTVSLNVELTSTQ